MLIDDMDLYESLDILIVISSSSPFSVLISLLFPIKATLIFLFSYSNLLYFAFPFSIVLPPLHFNLLQFCSDSRLYGHV